MKFVKKKKQKMIMIMRNIVETLYGPIYWATIHLAKSPGGVLPYETDGDARRKF